ncbi:DUF6950 family protein [Rhizobium sp. Root482]|uniref:DUF6950 family protein n=1 Tax=Rhizobium sp. Root482 TaxID=1736543 RepID=UPI000ABFB6F8|nr:hypothetical protein [Rhizobium sp. Root482]
MLDQWVSFSRAYGELPWEPGKVDCCLCLSAWAMWLGYSDPARHLRGTYDDEAGFRRIIEQAGSVTALVERCADSISAKRTQRPFCGSIGVIGSPTNIHRQFGAIHDGEGWNVRFIHGVHRMIATPLAIWSI